MKRAYWMAVPLLLAGCATAPERPDFTAFEAARPRSILVVPSVIWVMSTFWLQHLKILGPSHPVVGKVGEVFHHVWEILLPYLTARGLRSTAPPARSSSGPWRCST
jgi:hypothetical protein